MSLHKLRAKYVAVKAHAKDKSATKTEMKSLFYMAIDECFSLPEDTETLSPAEELLYEATYAYLRAFCEALSLEKEAEKALEAA